MSKTSEFVETAKHDLDKLGAELSEFETKVAAASSKADDWSKSQVAKLKTDLEQAKEHVSSLATRVQAESEEAVCEAKARAERHWQALHAAVKAYREHLNKTIAA